jgi:hypothetical protein
MLQHPRFFFFFLLLLLSLGCAASCAPTTSETPGMSATTRITSANATAGDDSIVVVFPRSPRTGTARIVFLDDDANFYGAVGPGEAAILHIPPPKKTIMLHAISAPEIHARPGTWFLVNDLIVSAPSGMLLDGGHYPRIVLKSRSQIETVLADPDREIQWLTRDRADGQRWIDEHKARVDELLARSTSVATSRYSAGVFRTWLP